MDGLGWMEAEMMDEKFEEDVLIATRSDLAAAYAKGADNYKEALQWCMPRLNADGLMREGMGRYPDKYDEVHKLAYDPIPAAPQPRDLGKLWAFYHALDKQSPEAATWLAAILKEMEGSR